MIAGESLGLGHVISSDMAGKAVEPLGLGHVISSDMAGKTREVLGLGHVISSEMAGKAVEPLGLGHVISSAKAGRESQDAGLCSGLVLGAISRGEEADNLPGLFQQRRSCVTSPGNSTSCLDPPLTVYHTYSTLPSKKGTRQDPPLTACFPYSTLPNQKVAGSDPPLTAYLPDSTLPSSGQDPPTRDPCVHNMFPAKTNARQDPPLACNTFPPWTEAGSAPPLTSAEACLRSLQGRIWTYNRRMKLPAFHARLTNQRGELGFEAAMRFYCNHGDGDHTNQSKAVRLRNTTTSAQLLPTLIDKFCLRHHVREGATITIHQVTGTGQRPLGADACPLELAVDSRATTRFVVRVCRPEQTASERLEPTSPSSRPSGEAAAAPLRSVTLNSKKSSANCLQLPSSASEQKQMTLSRRSRDRTSRSSRRSSAGGNAGVDDRLGLPDDAEILVIGADDTIRRMTGREKQRSKQTRRRSSSSAAVSLRSSPCPQRRDLSLDRYLHQRAREDLADGQLRNTSSMTSLFQKTFSLRKRSTSGRSHTTELSTAASAPGVLKIFGESICTGATYKSVLVAASSTAQELVKEALERYGIKRKRASKYVLCDVIGRLSHTQNSRQLPVCQTDDIEGVWTEECIRVIGDNERPLILQEFWKPSNGHARRFELRRRSDLLAMADIDTTTSGINANARRMLRSKAHQENPIMPQLEASELEEHAECVDQSVSVSVVGDDHAVVDRQSSSSYDDVIPMNRQIECDSVRTTRPPLDQPYLLLLQGFSAESDSIMYVLSDPVTLLGSGESGGAVGTICLQSPDVQSEHCWLHKCYLPKVNTDTVYCSVSVEISQGAIVRLNNTRLDQKTELQNGDIVSVGENYVFLYKAASTVDDKMSRTLSYLQELNHQRDGDSVSDSYFTATPECMDRGPALDSGSTSSSVSLCPAAAGEPREVREWRRRRNQLYEADHGRLKLSFLPDRQEEMLDRVIGLMEHSAEGYKLTPAYLLCMALEYSAVKHDQVSTRGMLLSMVTKIQHVVWDRTKELADKQGQTDNDPHAALSGLLPDLRPVLLWMSNSLELLHFFRQNLADYLLHPGTSLPPDADSALATVEEEVVTVLEDMVMYTFQQTVYYLTKILYSVLPVLLDSNPFSDEDMLSESSVGGERPSVDAVLAVYQDTLNVLQDYHLHPQVLSQLFCYLFFFTSTSLFNMLFSKGHGSRYFRWSRGAQLRGNLDAVETWAGSAGLGQEAAVYLRKLGCVADLLATPRLHLMQADWTSLRRDFPSLTASQLHHLLSHYELGPGKSRPHAWSPPSGELPDQQTAGDLQESFTAHPPLVLPGNGFLLDLSRDLSEPSFFDLLADVNAAFGLADDDGDSGLSVTQAAPVEVPRATLYTGENDVPHTTSPQGAPRHLTKHQGTPPPMTNHQVAPTQSPSCVRRPKPAPPERRCSRLSLNSDVTDDVTDAHTVRGRRETVTTFKSQSNLDKSFDEDSHSLKSSSIQTSEFTCHGKEDKLKLRRVKERRKGQVTLFPQTIPRERQRHGCHESANVPNSGVGDPSHIYENYPFETDRCSELPAGVADHTPPLAMSSPLASSDSGTPSPSPTTDAARIPPQPTTPAPVLHCRPRASTPPTPSPSPTNTQAPLLRVELADQQTRAQPEAEVVDVGHYVDVTPASLSPRSPGGGLVVLPLPQDLPREPTPESAPPAEDQRSVSDTCLPVPGCSSDDPDVGDDSQVFTVELTKGSKGLGLGLIDGLFTPLGRPGIYVRTLVRGEPAARDGRLQLGDRILAVNGASVVGADYQSAMRLIRNGGHDLEFMVAKSDFTVAMQVTASSC